jgi:hypothetical protein
VPALEDLILEKLDEVETSVKVTSQIMQATLQGVETSKMKSISSWSIYADRYSISVLVWLASSLCLLYIDFFLNTIMWAVPPVHFS